MTLNRDSTITQSNSPYFLSRYEARRCVETDIQTFKVSNHLRRGHKGSMLVVKLIGKWSEKLYICMLENICLEIYTKIRVRVTADRQLWIQFWLSSLSWQLLKLCVCFDTIIFCESISNKGIKFAFVIFFSFFLFNIVWYYLFESNWHMPITLLTRYKKCVDI